jgi:hypothetical protein
VDKREKQRFGKSNRAPQSGMGNTVTPHQLQHGILVEPQERCGLFDIEDPIHASSSFFLLTYLQLSTVRFLSPLRQAFAVRLVFNSVKTAMGQYG